MLSTASIFAGMLLMRMLIALTHFLDPDHERECLGTVVGKLIYGNCLVALFVG